MSKRFIAGFLTSKHRIVKYVRISLKLFFCFFALFWMPWGDLLYFSYKIRGFQFLPKKEITSFDIQLGNFVFDCEKNDKIQYKIASSKIV